MTQHYLNETSLNNYVIKANGKYMFIIKNKNLYFLINYLNIYKSLNYLQIIKYRYMNDILNFFFFSWNNYIVKKIKFKHKITWLYISRKNLNLLKVNTNLSQKVFFIIDGFKLKRKKNYFKLHTLTFWGVNLTSLNNVLHSIINLLFFNSYTQKGFRLSRMKLIKRVGKVSKYKGLKGKIF